MVERRCIIIATFLKATDYNGFYTTLNEIRTKHGASKITAYTASVNTPATSSQMSTLQTSVNTVKNNTDTHLSSASIDTTIPSIAKGNAILLSTKTKIDTILSQMLSVCHYNPCTACFSSCDSDDAYPYNEPNRRHDSNGSDCILTG